MGRRTIHKQHFVVLVATISITVLALILQSGFLKELKGQQFQERRDSPHSLTKVVLTDEERRWLHDHPVIRVAQDPSWAPVEFADEHGNPTGISNDYLTLVEHRLGITFQRERNLSWQEAYARLKRREIDMTTSVTPTAERTNFWIFTRPYLEIPIVIIAPKDITYIANMHELAGKKIGAVDGYVIADWVAQDYPDIKLVRVKNVEEGLHLLQTGELFGFADNMLITGYYLTKLKLTNLKVVGTTPYENKLGMAVRKDWPVFAAILQKALNSITESERNEIYNRWVPIRYEHGFDYTTLWQALAIFFVIVSILMYWNRKLSKEIKQRKKTEAALQTSEELYRKLITTIPDILIRTDLEGNIIFINETTLPYFGYTGNNRILGKNILELVSEKDRPRAVENFKKMFNDYLGPVVYSLSGSEGTFIDCEINGDVLRNNDGTPLGMVFIVRDLTEKKKMEMQLLQSQKMEAVGRLAGGVAHDYNNMLGIILGYASMIEKEFPSNHTVQNKIRAIISAAERSANLTKQLLAFARQQIVAPVVIDLNAEISSLQKMLGRLIGEDIQLTINPQNDLWKIKIDPTQCTQIITNLATNARDAIENVGTIMIQTENESVQENISTEQVDIPPADYVVLSFSDSGSGMDKKIIAKIFEPFFTTKSKDKGTGLGLSTVFGIVKQNHGFIAVTSEVGHGTTFKTYFPRFIGESEISLEEKKEVSLEGTETILIVEDEEQLLDLAKNVLALHGYNILSSVSPVDACGLCEKYSGSIDLLITDVIMPGMNGKELNEWVERKYPAIKTLFISGYTADIVAQRGVLEEGTNFLQKPFTLETLLKKIREILNKQ